jgi:hypothetical protein
MPICNSIAPTFLVPDVGATAEWYRTYLDFKADFFLNLHPMFMPACTATGSKLCC